VELVTPAAAARDARIRSFAQQKLIIPKSRQVRPLPAPRSLFKPPAAVIATINEPAPCMSLFRVVAGASIDSREERDRLISLRRQAGAGHALGLEAQLRRLVNFASQCQGQRLVPIAVPPSMGQVKPSPSFHVMW
jgi:hypothetical protein